MCLVPTLGTMTISTHTPVKGVTDGADIMYIEKYDFNSHAREGRDT